MTPEGKKAWARANRHRTRDYCQRYEKTPNGFLMRVYRNMKSRIGGVQKSKFHLYAGKSLMPKDEFYAWAKESPEFMRLFAAYEASGYQRGLAPSVDRVDSSRGYERDNLEWVTHSVNSARGSAHSHLKMGHTLRRKYA